jgi:cell division protein FtsB
MANPTAPEPPNGLDESGSVDAGAGGDLSAIPTFLRSRAPGDAAAPERSRLGWSVRRPVAVPAEVPDAAALRMAGISPRRLLQVVAIIAIAWGVVSFGRQVATASAASAHAASLRSANAQLQDQVAAMQRELALIQEHRYIDQQARAYRLGSAHEIPFSLEPGAPSLPPDAPGSAANRLGATVATGSPLDHWLELLFGPG